ncbi:MAG: hypothetical protein KA752_05950 [Giesbergeria sp.]|nr:hypothetical protein [Giesbergeria sp.]
MQNLQVAAPVWRNHKRSKAAEDHPANALRLAKLMNTLWRPFPLPAPLEVSETLLF